MHCGQRRIVNEFENSKMHDDALIAHIEPSIDHARQVESTKNRAAEAKIDQSRALIVRCIAMAATRVRIHRRSSCELRTIGSR